MSIQSLTQYIQNTDLPLYPVVPSFRDWPFPHGQLPAFWPSVPVSGRASDSCILTDSSYSKTEAHLVPKEEGDWFKYNSMGRYGLDRQDIEDSANLASLRADVHTWLDAQGWTIAPKAAPEEYRYVANVLNTVQAPEFYTWYHNVQLRLSGRQATQYIFARFAWTMIQLVKPFIISSSPRTVIHVQTDPGKAVTWVEETMQSDQLDKLYGRGGSRSASPNKRRKSSSTRTSGACNDDLSRDAEVNRLYNCITADHEARVYAQKVKSAAAYDQLKTVTKRRRASDNDDDLIGLLEDWEERGRPRKRRSLTITNEDDSKWKNHGKSNTGCMWTTDHGDNSSKISTVASLGRESCSPGQSDVDPLEDTEGLSTCLSAPRAPQVSVQNDVDSHVGEVVADVPPERSKPVST